LRLTAGVYAYCLRTDGPLQNTIRSLARRNPVFTLHYIGPGPNATFLLGEQHLTHEATGRVPKENRGMSLHHYPQLLQSLPGKVQDDIERQPEDVALDKEIEALRETLKGLSTGHETKQDRARWEELYW
jgi:hypothetical protein